MPPCVLVLYKTDVPHKQDLWSVSLNDGWAWGTSRYGHKHNSRTTSWHSHTACLWSWQWGEPREVLNHGHLSPIRRVASHAAGMEGVHWQANASEQSPEAYMGRIPAEFLRRWDYFLLRWLMRRSESTFCSVCCWWYHDKLFNARPNFTVCFKANGTSWHFQRMSIKYNIYIFLVIYIYTVYVVIKKTEIIFILAQLLAFQHL